MQQRTRSKSRSYAAGSIVEYYWWDPGTPYVIGGPWTVPFEEQHMVDFHEKEAVDGFLPASDLQHTKVERIVSGASGQGFWRFYDVPPDYATGLSIPVIIPSGADKGDDYYAVELLARTNPFRSEYSVPVAIREMVDIAEMFKLAASSFLRYVGGAYLNYKFGWLTFVDDVKTLHNLTQIIESRMKELSSLFDHGGLRRKVLLDRYRGSESGSNVQFHSTWGISIVGDVDHSTTTKVTGSVRWLPTKDFAIPLDGLTNFNLAVKQVLDLDELTPKTVWELIPFSWLADYFLNLSVTFGAMEGRGLVDPRDVCIMRNHRTTTVGKPDYALSNATSGGGFTLRQEVRKRKVIYGVDFPPVLAGILNSNQYLVLAALLAKFSSK